MFSEMRFGPPRQLAILGAIARDASGTRVRSTADSTAVTGMARLKRLSLRIQLAESFIASRSGVSRLTGGKTQKEAKEREQKGFEESRSLKVAYIYIEDAHGVP